MPRDGRPLDRRVAAAIRSFSPICRWLPTRPRSSLAFTILALCIVCLVLQFGFWEDKFPVQSGFVYRLRDGSQSHPVEHLHAAAKKQFDALLARQSTTPEGAVVEYRRRYGRVPPPGFERWFAFAREHSSPIVDDYDEMMRSLEPFWKMAPADVVRLMERSDSPGQTRGAIKKCFVAGGKLKDCGAWADVMSRYLGAALRGIPNMTFLANYMDEPAVLPRHPIVSPSDSDEKFVWSEISHQPIWPQVQDVCAKIGGPSEKAPVDGALAAEDSGEEPRFVRNVTRGTDLCAHPEFREAHGYLASAVSSFHIGHAVPVLSRAVPRPFGDILFPAPSYSWPQFAYSAWRDRSWRRKTDALYWAGSNTGSYTHDETWRRHHRQRLVLLGLGADEGKKFTYLRKAGGGDSWMPYTTSRFDRSLYHVAMTKIRACDEPACREQNDAFRPRKKPEPASEPYRYKYVFDIDGNSLSGRFYRLLASNSAVLKTTIFKEWHDERLVPWLHYIPVSLGLEELPELVRFLATTDEGREVGRRVAEAGKRWHAKALREVDRGVYFYRLLLEIAWLQSTERAAG
jgi:hypothetical protein